MKRLIAYCIRFILVILSIYYVGKELWWGKEGIRACESLKADIECIAHKKVRLQKKIEELNKERSYLSDPEFLTEQQLRQNDLKQKDDLLYLI